MVVKIFWERRFFIKKWRAGGGRANAKPRPEGRGLI